MNKNNLKREDVVKVSLALVKYHGDINEVFSSLSETVSKEMITKIKEKKYMAAVSNLYFKKNSFNINPKTTVPAPMIPTNTSPTFDSASDIKGNFVSSAKMSTKMVVNDENVVPSVSPEPKEKKKRKRLSEETVRKICETLVKYNGDLKQSYEALKRDNVDIKPHNVNDIKHKYSNKEISDEYFLSYDKYKKQLILPKPGQQEAKTVEKVTTHEDSDNEPYTLNISEFIESAVEAVRKKPFDWIITFVGGDESYNKTISEMLEDIRRVIEKTPIYKIKEIITNSK